MDDITFLVDADNVARCQVDGCSFIYDPNVNAPEDLDEHMESHGAKSVSMYAG